MFVKPISLINGAKNVKNNFAFNGHYEKKGDEKTANKKLIVALGCLAIIGSSLVIISKQKSSVNLSKISFNNGVASLKRSGSKFTGTVKDTLKNGDKIALTYEDGILKKSLRTGNVNVSKEFGEVLGQRCVKKSVDGKTTLVNIARKINGNKSIVHVVKNKI